ncbi:hypothetical protein [Lentzea sp. NPDC003310]|uniref:hypothetical protein n=1 Tax=Lentzea sp. NPDC003310 TaxID=3154447 RepID=UPI0033B9ABB8
MNKFRTASIALTAATAASLLLAPAAHADESGINGSISVKAVGSGGHVHQVQGKVTSVGTYLAFDGFFRLFGPDYSVTSETRRWGQGSLYYHNVDRDYADGQKHCAEGWMKKDDGTFELIGRPCVENPI